MPNWKNASKGDQRRLQAITLILKNYPWLVDEIFDATEPCLRISSEALLRGRSSGEKLLIQCSLDAWNGSGHARVDEFDNLDSGNFENLISGLRLLR